MIKTIYKYVPIIMTVSNWLISLSIILVPTITSINIHVEYPKVERFMGFYLTYSFAPAIISLALPRKSTPKWILFIVLPNIIFLILYVLAFWAIRMVQMYA